jgi:hypothetical protein
VNESQIVQHLDTIKDLYAYIEGCKEMIGGSGLLVHRIRGLLDERDEAIEIIESLLPPDWILRMADRVNAGLGVDEEPRMKRARDFLARYKGETV